MVPYSPADCARAALRRLTGWPDSAYRAGGMLRPRTAFFVVAVIAATALAAGVFAAGSEDRAQGPGTIPVGTHAGFRFYGAESSIAAEMQAQRAMGITALREDVQWSTVESTQGTYVWTGPDRFIKQAAANGYRRIYLPLTKTPGWAASSDAAAPVTADATLHHAYRAFVAAAVARYRHGGTFWQAGQPGAGLTAPEVYFEIWNEPWGSWAWKNADGSQRTPSGIEYAQMAKAVVQHVRGLHGAGGYAMLCHTQSFTNTVPGELFHVRVWDGATDIGDWCDGWSVHAYPEFEGPNPKSDPDYYTPSGTTGAQRLDAVKYQFRRYLPMRQIDHERSGRALPIHLTEVGWPTSGSSNTVSEAEQAAHHASVFRIARADRAFAGLVTYMWRDQRPRDGTLSREHFFGTRRSDGTTEPAHTAMANELATGIPDPLPYVPPKR
jgi:polysaccharide biosynthesis protein PslG